MPTQEERIDQLEKEVNHNLTMLLGIASGQERTIRTIQDDVRVVKDRTERMDSNIASLDEKVDKGFASVDKRFISLEEKFDERLASVDKRFVSLEEKFEQMLQMLAKLTSR